MVKHSNILKQLAMLIDAQRKFAVSAAKAKVSLENIPITIFCQLSKTVLIILQKLDITTLRALP